MEATPPFHRLFFIERDAKNVAALQHLTEGDPRASVISGEANEQVGRICANTNWLNTRGVIFLDPFGNSVEWNTLESVIATKALDVWYLFPLAGVYRNAPRDRDALTQDPRNRCVGRTVLCSTRDNST
jgi:three-Cys-motif partner protein